LAQKPTGAKPTGANKTIGISLPNSSMILSSQTSEPNLWP